MIRDKSVRGYAMPCHAGTWVDRQIVNGNGEGEVKVMAKVKVKAKVMVKGEDGVDVGVGRADLD
jgi:hypothetical protein